MANRRERRWQLRQAKMLRIKNMYSRFSEIGVLWYNKTMSEGKALHQQNVERNERTMYEALSEKEGNLKVYYESLGYSSEKVEKMLEAWRIGVVKAKDKEERRAEKKQQRALLKEAAQMK